MCRLKAVLAAAARTGKALRLRFAKERQVPAYAVFSDRTLIDAAEHRPRDLDAFAEVNGGERRSPRSLGRFFSR